MLLNRTPYKIIKFDLAESAKNRYISECVIWAIGLTSCLSAIIRVYRFTQLKMRCPSVLKETLILGESEIHL